MTEKEVLSDVVRRALAHYAEKVSKMRSEDVDKKDRLVDNDIIGTDLEELVAESKAILEKFKPELFTVLMKDHKQDICAALQVYYSDLGNDRSKTAGKLRRDKLSNADVELDHVLELIKSYCQA